MNIYAKSILGATEKHLIIAQNDSIEVNITIKKFKKLCRKVNRKIKHPEGLTVEDCIICVRLYNSFPRNLSYFPSSREYHYNKLRKKLYEMGIFFSYKLEASMLGKYYYSKKYDIWIGGGIGGAATHYKSRYHIINRQMR